MLPLSQDAFIEKTLPQGVLKVLYWEVYSWKTLDPVMLESRAAEPAPQLSDRLQSTEGEQQPGHQLPSLQQRASSYHPVPSYCWQEGMPGPGLSLRHRAVQTDTQ